MKIYMWNFIAYFTCHNWGPQGKDLVKTSNCGNEIWPRAVDNWNEDPRANFMPSLTMYEKTVALAYKIQIKFDIAELSQLRVQM